MTPLVTPPVLDELAKLGEFFAVHTHPAASAVATPWHPMSELTENPTVLRDRVAAVRTHLATTAGKATKAIPTRVAASVTQLGLVARLISPMLAITVITAEVPTLNLQHARWQRTLGGPFPLSLPAPTPTATNQSSTSDRTTWQPQHLATLFAGSIVDGPIREVVNATQLLSVSEHVLWGNVASAINSAASMIATTRPEWAPRTRDVTRLLLSQPPLHGTHTRSVDGAFRRRNCCLIYQATPQTPRPVCGDCILTNTPPSKLQPPTPKTPAQQRQDQQIDRK